MTSETTVARKLLCAHCASASVLAKPPRAMLVILALLPAVAAAVPPELTRYVPPAALASVLVDRTGTRTTTAPAASGLAVLLASRAKEMGLIPNAGGATGLFVDLAAALPAVTQHPWALTLLDVSATPDDDGRHLADLRLALIVLTHGQNEEIERQIRRALSGYTNSELSTLRARAIDGASVFELIDSRLPAWCTLRWGAVADAYVVTIGERTFERVMASHAGGAPGERAEWLGRARRECRSADATVEWWVDFTALRSKLANIGSEQIGGALDALGLGQTDLALWTVGSVGREITCYSYAQAGGQERRDVIAGPHIRNPLPSAWIPPHASAFAVFDHPPATLLRRLAAGYLATCNESWREKLRANWQRLQEQTGVDVERDVLEQLGDHVLVHTWPPHPLGIPILCTIELEIAGSAERVRSALDVLLEHYRQYLDAGRTGVNPFALMLKRDDDGVWFLQAGIYGPALSVTGRWVVISFSPMAVHQNAEFLRSVTAESASTPRSAESPARSGRRQ